MAKSTSLQASHSQNGHLRRLRGWVGRFFPQNGARLVENPMVLRALFFFKTVPPSNDDF